MDSPLEFLRRNQKTMLPIIAIACMVAFVALPGLLPSQRDPRLNNSKDQVVARWQGGELRESQLQNDVREYQQLAYFVSNLETEKQILTNPQLQQFAGEYFRAIQERFLQSNFGPTDLTRAADSLMFDQIGKDLGIVISDKQVNDFLDDLTGQPAVGSDGKPTGMIQTIVPKSSYDNLIKTIAKNDPAFNEERLFQLIKRMLTRVEVLRLFSPQNVFEAETPLARWENYRRIRQRSSIQAIPVRVADFVDGVREPKPEELNAFFEANKNRLADANSPEVGLRTPTRASFQLAYINMDRLVSSFKPRIENKAISDYYEKNKYQFQKSKLPTIESEKTTEPMPGDTKPADPTSPETKTPETKTPETKTPETKPAEPATTTTPPATQPAPTEPAKSEPKVDGPKSEAPKTDPAKSEPAAPKEDATKKQSAVFRDGLIPVNFQADAKEPAKSPAPATTEPAKTEPAAAEPTKSEPAQTEPAKADATKSETPKSEPAKTEPAKPVPVEYKPLAEVESEIRETLAREQANAQANLLMQKIEDEMFAYKKRRDRATYAAEDPSKVQFEAFDMAKTTAAIDPTIEAETLTLVSRDQFAKHPVSGATVQNLQGASLLDIAYNDKLFPIYDPLRPLWLTGRYIIWKTEQRPDEVPVLSDPEVKQRAIAAWKMVEARKDAEKQAQQYAEIAKKAEIKDGKPQTLTDLYNAKVLPVAPNEIGSFSWMTPGLQQNEPPSITKVNGLDSAGHDLMQMIFNLKQNEIGVAPNEPKSVYYVVQVIETSDMNKLRDSFLQDVRTLNGWQQFAAANINEQITEYRSFFDKLRQRYKLEFVNTPSPTE
jgi:hypothetical protein